jgi:hypothetical protein|tara:strand:- start:309 stop:509 length:201 start_codon:yes stop_codon:yes gene_type:complete
MIKEDWILVGKRCLISQKVGSLLLEEIEVVTIEEIEAESRLKGEDRLDFDLVEKSKLSTKVNAIEI